MDSSAASLGTLITTVAASVAEAQRTIDERVLEHFSAVYDQSKAAFEPLRAIRYQPAWYQISEATAQVKLAMTATASRDVRGALVDAGYRARFGYSHASASSLTIRIVPVPPPAALE